MEKFETMFCKLCFKFVSDGNVKVIEETTREMFDVLLLKLVGKIICNRPLFLFDDIYISECGR